MFLNILKLSEARAKHGMGRHRTKYYNLARVNKLSFSPTNGAFSTTNGAFYTTNGAFPQPIVLSPNQQCFPHNQQCFPPTNCAFPQPIFFLLKPMVLFHDKLCFSTTNDALPTISSLKRCVGKTKLYILLSLCNSFYVLKVYK